MPLTFAHPAAVLPFIKTNTYFHFTALVLGSMAPDFEYFLRGRPAGEIGHSLLGFFIYNLPLVALIYIVYRYIIFDPFFQNLPHLVQPVFTESVKSNNGTRQTWISVIVFLYSALLGMITHVVWDSFTHKGGFMAVRWGILQETISISTFDIPVYKLLQHGSTLLGLFIIFICFLTLLWKKRSGNSLSIDGINLRSGKWKYWISLILLMILILFLWMVIEPITLSEYGVFVVRVIDSGILSVLFVSVTFQLCSRFSTSNRQ
ncbi:DUF4184 family protein [Paenibacillus sp. Marseille-Q4541]|uniref:DUF4184 family protein n=1 Tax=Paenibacillus sp. Marseille-Q4541 TaxID=2831522 RepID=UPI001BAB7F20|nr:DUF4184 family protein [Paenibacillus sp. Marseille-Q4541]